jgi:hypothetical protein
LHAPSTLHGGIAGQEGMSYYPPELGDTSSWVVMVSWFVLCVCLFFSLVSCLCLPLLCMYECTCTCMCVHVMTIVMYIQILSWNTCLCLFQPVLPFVMSHSSRRVCLLNLSDRLTQIGNGAYGFESGVT